MGYTDFSLKKFSRAFLARQGVERAIAFYGIKKRRMAHGAHPSLISDFLKDIVALIALVVDLVWFGSGEQFDEG